jgi:biopolymer transport protein ExbB/TolQ
MNWKKLKEKTWIDWVKIVVAVDIAGVGIGLVLGFNMHVFAHTLGFLSRIIFGIMYVFVAVLIFKRIFPQALAEEEKKEAQKMDAEITETTHAVKKGSKKFIQKINELTDVAHQKIDHVLDKGASFASKRKKEVKEEMNKLMKH